MYVFASYVTPTTYSETSSSQMIILDDFTCPKTFLPHTLIPDQRLSSGRPQGSGEFHVDAYSELHERKSTGMVVTTSPILVLRGERSNTRSWLIMQVRALSLSLEICFRSHMSAQ